MKFAQFFIQHAGLGRQCWCLCSPRLLRDHCLRRYLPQPCSLARGQCNCPNHKIQWWIATRFATFLFPIGHLLYYTSGLFKWSIRTCFSVQPSCEHFATAGSHDGDPPVFTTFPSGGGCCFANNSSFSSSSFSNRWRPPSRCPESQSPTMTHAPSSTASTTRRAMASARWAS